jgi:hypothetical protein
MRSRKGPAGVLLAAGLLLAALNVGATVHRSLIPVAVDGVITRVEVRREKHPGLDDVWLLHTAGRSLHTDAAIAEQLQVGQRISKRPWQRRLEVDSAPVALRLSDDAVGMLWLMPLLLGALAALLWWPRRPGAPA